MYSINQICAVEVTEYKYTGSFRIGDMIQQFEQNKYSIEQARQKLQLKEGWVTLPGTVDSLTKGIMNGSSCIYMDEDKVSFSFNTKISSVITHRIEGTHYQIPWENYVKLKYQILKEKNVKKVGTSISTELEETLYKELKNNSR
ncbi:hypothetical protein HN385_01790 [archaeon]|jgi:hypothetical protein|nr:hypothetical protein [archaeon]MBT3451561.1 hypothetical protein [archaeon]MBT6869420.1 hypothetical protein [archaeon]MBT7192583.1 hypothetical protein [archaeon]MBT7380659.1 hypothetical protein [archaeon]